MRISISDLAYAGFRYNDFCKLDNACGLEFFYEFGTRAYWDTVLPLMTAGRQNGISMHGPCVQVNLAEEDPDRKYLKVFLDAFTYAKQIGAEFVVVHTNEALPTDLDKLDLQQRVREKLQVLLALSENVGVQMVIENVGLRPKGSLLFDREAFLELPQRFPTARFLLDTGHAHVNGWDLADTVKALGKRLMGCHVHDNDGNGDQHLYVGAGNIKWEPFFEAVLATNPDARIVLEYAKLPCEGMAAHVAGLCKRFGI